MARFSAQVSKIVAGGETKQREATRRRSMADRVLSRGGYLTDGKGLYRVIAPLGPATDRGLVELEDCRSLEIFVLSTTELRRGRLRPVLPAVG